MIKLAIAEDENMIANLIKENLESNDIIKIKVLHCVYNGDDIISIIKEAKIDIVLLDLNMPGQNGFQILKKMQSINSKVKALIISSKNYPALHSEIKKLGAWGYIPKSSSTKEIISAIKTISEGEKYFIDELLSKKGPRKFISNYKNLVLSSRERIIVKFLVEGQPNKIIAHLSNVEESTIKGQKYKLFQKFGVNTTSELLSLIKKYKIEY